MHGRSWGAKARPFLWLRLSYFFAALRSEGTAAAKCAQPIKSPTLGNTLAVLCAASMTACTGGVSGGGISTVNTTPAAASYTVGVTVSGLLGTGLALQVNAGNTLSVPSSGVFTFTTPLASGDLYNVTVLTQPSSPTQSCVPNNGSGTIGEANVTDITVVCSAKTSQLDTIGGTVAGLLGSGLVLQDNGANDLTISASGAFTFSQQLPAGNPYAVSVLTPPVNPYQDCTVTDGRGTTGASNVNNVLVACTTNSNTAYSITAVVTGIPAGTPASVTLADNGRDQITVSANGSYTFATSIPSGSIYSVTATALTDSAQSLSCAIAQPSGVVKSAPVTVKVSCSAQIKLSVLVTGLQGSGLTLQDNAGDDLSIAGNGIFTFAVPLNSGQPYSITVLSLPTDPSQTCNINGDTGTVGASPMPSVTCVNLYPVGVTISAPQGFTGTLALNNNGANELDITASDTCFVTLRTPTPPSCNFTTQIASDSVYAVTIKAQPGTADQNNVPAETSLVCTTYPSTASGTVTTGAVTVAITCVAPLAFAYVANSADNTVTSFVVTTAGLLVQFAAPIATGKNPAALAINPEDDFSYLYVANGASSTISQYTVDPNTGVLSAVSGSPFSPRGLSGPNSISTGQLFLLGLDQTSPLDVMYVTNKTANTVSAFSIGTGGALTSVGNYPLSPSNVPATGPASATFLPSLSDYFGGLYTANETSNNISEFTADTTGALTAAGSSPLALESTGNPEPLSIVSLTTVLNPTVFLANGNDGTLYSYAVDTTDDSTGGELAPASRVEPFATYTGVYGLAVSQLFDLVTCQGIPATCTGAYLYASGSQGLQQFNMVVINGTLVPLSIVSAGAPVPAGSGAGPIAVFPVGATSSMYIFVVNQNDDTVSEFVSVADATTGVLGQPSTQGTVPTGDSPSTILVVPRPAIQEIGIAARKVHKAAPRGP